MPYKKTTVKYPVYGDEGKEVLMYQKLLIKAGSKIKTTGIFTIGMASAIRAFQKKSKLAVTGKLDAKTVAALAKLKTAKK